MAAHRQPKPALWRRASVRFLALLAAGLTIFGVAAGVALAYWTSTGTGAASATTGTLNAPTGVTVPANSSGSVNVSWTAPATGVTPSGYYVTRIKSDNTTANACGTSPSSTISGTSCTDSVAASGSYTYKVTAVYHSWTATSAASNTVVVNLATQLAFTTQPPSSAQAGGAFSTAVTVEDASNNPVPQSGISVTIAIGTNPSGGTLSGTLTVNTDASGVATFPGLSINKVGTGYTLAASSSGLTGATSNAFNIAPSAASKLAFTTQPSSSATGGSAFSQQPVVTIQDANDNTVTSSSASVTLALTTPGGATLTCTNNPVSASSGVATFAGCNIDKAGTYTLTATSGTLTAAVSTSISVTVGPAAKLVFSTQPSASATGGTAFAQQPVVSVTDLGGNVVTSSSASVTLTLTTPAGATLTCTNNTVTASSGVASFGGCKINKTGTYTLTAASGSLTSAISTSITVSVGAAAQLAFTTQPSSSATGGTAFGQQPVVTVQDAGGNTVTTATDAATLTLTTPAGATLTCTNNTVNASAGIATFAGCKINKTGTYTLTASSGTLTSTVSNAISVSVGPAAQLAFTTQPSSSATGGTAFGQQPVVTIQDAGGNTVTSSSASVTLALTTAGGATLSCTNNTVTASSGLATFGGCKIDKTGSYTLTASSSGLTSAVSTLITVNVGAAAKLAFTTQPSASASGGSAFAQQPVVTVQDAGGNTVTGSSASVNLALTTAGGGTLSCTTNPLGASAGVAAYAGCSIDKTGSYTLTATSGLLTSAQSNAISVAVGAAAKLAFTTQPSSSATSGTAFTTQPVVQLQDAGGNNVTTSGVGITLAITAPAGGATLTCTNNTVNTTAAGNATFSGCKINLAGTYTLTATSGSLASSVSTPITVAGAAAKLAFSTSPSDSNGGTVFGTQPVVQVQDAGGNLVTASSASITLALTTPNGATLTCTNNPKSASGGIATFAGCKVDLAGLYTLTATATGLTSATSSSFTISVPPDIVLANGGTLGKADNGDTVTIQYPTQVQASTLCSTWNQSGTQQLTTNGQVAVTITDNGANDTLTVSTTSGCTFNFGSIALNADYVSATETFSGSGTNNKSTVSLTQNGLLTITFGNGSPAGNSRTGVAASTPSYTPASGITDASSNPITGFSATSATRF